MNFDRIKQFWFAPCDTIRLDTFRFALGIFLLLYMHERWLYASEWLTPAGFHPSPGNQPFHPLSVPLLPEEALPFFGAVLFGSIFAFTIGWHTKWVVWVVWACVSYVTFADQYAAYTLNKLSVVSLFVLACASKGSYWSVTDRNIPQQSIWAIRILQATFVIQYFAAGWNKAVLGDWLDSPFILWTHMQGYYRTDVAAWLLNNIPLKGWAFMQISALLFELLVPVLFIIPSARRIGFIWGSCFQLMIALCMHQLIYFMLIMWCFYIVFIDEKTLHRFYDVFIRKFKVFR
ncbi:MAG TPA: hypothetical protein VI749_08590 [Candidatus Omnitrophota bacterium]|nr:hypothetical protein [Candidatus Omnitrophota bacterium]